MRKILHPGTAFAGMATVEGRETSCKKAVASLMNQRGSGFKHVLVANQEIDGRSDDWRKLAGITRLMNERGLEGYVFTADDDLVYPEDYAIYMISQCRKNRGGPVSLMGRVLTRETKSYYTDTDAMIKYDWRDVSAYYGPYVHVPGTGVMCFHTSAYKPSLEHMPTLNALDLNIGLDCAIKGVKIKRVPPARKNWLRYMKQEDTIYDRHKDSCIEQTIMANRIYSLVTRDADSRT